MLNAMYKHASACCPSLFPLLHRCYFITAMKTFLVKYLWKEASFFSWLVVLLVVGTLVYCIIILTEMQRNMEAMMGFFLLPVAVAIIAAVVVADILTRKKGPAKRSRLLLLQILLALPFLWMGWHRYFYQTTLYLQADVQWILFVQTNKANPNVHRSILLPQTTIQVPPDGIVFVDRFFRTNERQGLKVINTQGEKESYVGEYGTNSYGPPLQCNGHTYPGFVLVIEKQPNHMTPLSDTVLQRLYKQACVHLQ